MPAEEYPHLFSPIRLGRFDLRNRVATTAHFSATCVEGLITDRTIAYYRERFRHHVALMVTEANRVQPVVGHGRLFMEPFRDEIVPGYRRLTQAVHDEGGRILCQLYVDGMHDLSAPSSLPVVNLSTSRGTAHALEIDEIQEIIGQYASAARRVREGGFDGVEITAAHGLLLHGFLTPYFNHRQDAYGGDLTGRMRFLIEVLTAVRGAIGPDRALGVRLSGSDFVEGGLKPEDVQEIARRLEASGLIDLINVTGAITQAPRSVIMHMGHIDDPHCQIVPLAAAIKRAVRLPILHASRIRTGREAEDVLAAGHADIVGMTRALVSDARLLSKIKSGQESKIFICVGCEEGCVERTVYTGSHITCVHNPICGREAEWGTLQPAARSCRVVVVGGGPAGLCAAQVASARGHSVVLLERQQKLGGKVLIAAKAPLLHELGLVAKNLINQIDAGSIDIRTGVEGTAESILALKPDKLVIATGSLPFYPALPSDGTVPIATVEDLLEERIKPGRRVVILDAEGRYRGMNTGIWLAEHGCEPIFVTELPFLGGRLGIEKYRVRPYSRLLGLGVPLNPYAGEKVLSVKSRGLEIENVFSGGRRRIEGVDLLAIASYGVSNQALWRTLRGKLREVHLIGDAFAPRDIERACFEGHQVARQL